MGLVTITVFVLIKYGIVSYPRTSSGQLSLTDMIVDKELYAGEQGPNLAA